MIVGLGKTNYQIGGIIQQNHTITLVVLYHLLMY